MWSGSKNKHIFKRFKKVDVKSSTSLYSLWFFRTNKQQNQKTQCAEYTVNIQLLLKDTGEYLLPYSYLADTLIADTFFMEPQVISHWLVVYMLI